MDVPTATPPELPVLIERLRAAGVRLRIEGDQLRYEAPAGALSADLLEQMRANKTSLLAFVRSAVEPATPPRAIARVPRTAAMPVSVAQQRLWLLYHLDHRGATYNVPKAVRLRGALDVDALERAFAAVIDRHESLRTSFEAPQGQPVQTIHPRVEFHLERRTLSHLPADGRFEAAQRAVSAAACEPFDLARAPLLRAQLIRLEAADHVLAVVLHHIVADGRSLEVLFEELAEAYAAARSGAPPPWPPLPIQYADYAVFERSWLDRPEMAARVDWWRTRLADAPPILQLPTDRPRPPAQTFAGGMERLSIPADLTARLRALGRDRGASLYMMVVAAMAALLSALSGQEDICLGCPAENRPFPETSNLIGAFINTLVLRIPVGRRHTFAQLLDTVSHIALEAYERQDVPFERLVEVLQPERNTSASPFFQVALSGLDGRRGFLALPGLETEPIDFEFGRVKFDLNLELYETDAELHIAWFYNSALFDAATIRRWGGYLIRLLDAAAAAPSRPIVDLPFLPDSDLAALERWNATESVYPDHSTVIDEFEAQVRRTPDAPAVTCGARSVTYAELNQRAGAVSAALGRASVGRGGIVAILMDRSIDVVAAILGVLKTGGAYLPLDTTAPSDRLAFMLRDSRAAVLLVDQSHGDRVPADTAATVLAVEALPAGATPVRATVTPADAAYVMYTSGSTGTPKAVVMEHRGLLNYLWWAKATYTRGQALSFPLFTTLSFDLTVTSLYVPLLTGGRLVVYPEDHAVPAIFQVIREKCVDVVKLTPAHLAMIADVDLRNTGIRTLIVGGDDLKTDLTRRIFDSFEGAVAIFNEYGPTEAAVGCMLYRFDPARDRNPSVPIGLPAGNARVHVLDRFQRIAPIGAIGELYVAGDGVARGYLGRPELTAERFVPDPSGRGARMYRTGDLARRRADGVIEYLGRVDRQVKIRGHRIELDEIAGALAMHEHVSDCVVQIVDRERTADALPAVEHCLRCGLASNYPGTYFDTEGVCDACRAFAQYRHRVESYFKTPDDFRQVLDSARTRRTGAYDCLALVSGGKDSIFMLARLRELGADVLAYTFDPGYLSEQAKDNIRRVTSSLGVDHMFGTTPHMNEIFAESLTRHANVCNGCFKTLYTLSIAAARERGIPMIATGLSRGQLFETRLSKYYNNPGFDPETLDAAIIDARKIYHRLDDAISRRLDVSIFQDDRLFDQIQIVDFYRYFDVGLGAMLAFLQGIGWKRPADTGRSTNCLINDAGIFVHTRRRGYHNYALPYSWDVRMGHKTRAEAIAELDDQIDEPRVRAILSEVGFNEPVDRAPGSEQAVVAYYVATGPVTEDALRAGLARRLPAVMIPAAFVPLERLPLTPNGKVDRRALPIPKSFQPATSLERVPPRTEIEREIAVAWSNALGFDGFSVHDNFFALGGHSLMATQVAARLAAQFGVDLPLAILFDKPTIAELSALVTPMRRARAQTLDDILAEVDRLSDHEVKEQLGS